MMLTKKLTKIILAAMLTISMGMIAGCSSKSEHHIIVAGSTSVQPYIEVLAEDFAALHPDEGIDVQGGGSSAGITAAQMGTADIGMSSRELKSEEEGLWVVEIAKDGLAVVINPSNKIRDLTTGQVRDMFAGEIKNWSQVGGQDAQIHLIAREDGSGTRGAFEELVMGEEYRITPKAIVQGSNGAVIQIVSGDPHAIGFISLGLVDKKVKAIRLDGASATRENVINQSYKLFRPFLFVAKEKPDGLVMEFIDYVLSDTGRKLLTDEGLIPEAAQSEN